MEKSKSEFIDRMKVRVKTFVVSVTALYRQLPKSGEAQIFGKQLLRAASSVGANYWASCRARSGREFFSKISIVVEEADEVCFWLEVIQDTDLLSVEDLAPVRKEALEILSIVAKARKTFRENQG